MLKTGNKDPENCCEITSINLQFRVQAGFINPSLPPSQCPPSIQTAEPALARLITRMTLPTVSFVQDNFTKLKYAINLNILSRPASKSKLGGTKGKAGSFLHLQVEMKLEKQNAIMIIVWRIIYNYL